ncbi:hypothetical protein G7076_10080 [Sphingomonas sp. HDW15A]|uniref:hypothetical protein n=1 Tax=Sphingomonas sp. HDW15A TaxID=2714942 RepID=UPI00140B3124|nr:hypothetical protein [Sphingomonas sp. HDW15A]QIK96737.1 hypothetical protein G7076_10080 [Sphingomonas sp. HDW15A]
MPRPIFCAALIPIPLLCACEPEQPATNRNLSSSEPTAEAHVDLNRSAVPASPTAEPADTAGPDLAPPNLTPEAERGEKSARNVLLSFARAIELKEFNQAWALLSPADKARWSQVVFAKIFADLGKISVAVPAGTMEGAAGSTYYSAPIIITANDMDGRPVRIEGEAMLRRVNDVPGATPEQLHWHFETLKLDWTH